MNLSHRDAFALIQQAVDGPLSQVARTELDRHLADCPQCQADAALFGGLKDAVPANLPEAIPDDQADRLMIQAVNTRLRWKRNLQRVFSPLPAIAWIAAAILLFMALGWAISATRPGVDSLFPSALNAPALNPDHAAGSDSGPTSTPTPKRPYNLSSRWVALKYYWVRNIQNLVNWLWNHTLLAGLIPTVFIGAIGVYFTSRQSSGRATRGWLIFLLCALGLFISALFLIPSEYGGIWVILGPPVIGVTLSTLVFHLWLNPLLWTRRTLILMILYVLAVCVIIAGPWIVPDDRALKLWVLVLCAIPTLLWFSLTVRGIWRWPIYILLLILWGICLGWIILPSFAIAQVPTWLRLIYAIAMISWPAAATILAAKLVYSVLSKEGPLTWPRILLITVLLAAIFTSTFAMIWTQATRDKVQGDAFLTTLFMILASVGAYTAAISIAGKLVGWRRLAGLALVIVFTAALIPAVSGPSAPPETLTRQRAEVINQAILRFYDKNQRYPGVLNELVPWYLWRVPEPVTYWNSIWCYEGGVDYYRLGYYYSSQPRSEPTWFTVKAYASAGEPPDPKWQCEIELDKAIELYNQKKNQ